MSKKRYIISSVSVASGLLILVAVVLGVQSFVGGRVAEARQIATQLQAAASTHPNPVAATAPVLPSPSAVAGVHAASGSGSAVAVGGSTASSAGGQTTTSVGSAAVTGSVKAAPQASTTPTTTARTTSPTHKTTPVTAASSVAPITTPTPAEVNEAISAVHDLLPFFTPTAAEIQSAGIQTCTALNDGDTFVQVQAAALNMVGAGSFASYIPSADTAVAIQTLVALYCPANASKVAS